MACVSSEDNHDNRAVHAAARENDKQAKQCQKTYADKRNKAGHNNLHVGDMVLMHNDKRSNKLSSAFSHKPMFVTDIRGTAVTAVDDNHSIRQNTSRFNKVLDPLPCFKNKLVVEKSMSLLGQSCRQHRLQSFILRIRVSAMLRAIQSPRRLSSLQPLAICPRNNDHSEAGVFPADWMTTRSTRSMPNA